MQQHAIFEDGIEARRRSDELLAVGLLDDVAYGGVFGDLGLGGQPDAGDRASMDALRSRALGGGGGGVCLLVVGHCDFVCLCLVSQVVTNAPKVYAQTKIACVVKHYKRGNT